MLFVYFHFDTLEKDGMSEPSVADLQSNDYSHTSHPTGRALTSDWFMVVCENIFKVQSKFTVHNTNKICFSYANYVNYKSSKM